MHQPSQSVDYPGHGIADGLHQALGRWGVVEEPFYQTKSHARETASAYISANFDVPQNEYREMLTACLQRPSLSWIHPIIMPILYASGEFLAIPS